MNAVETRVTSVACPTCKADIGVRCTRVEGSFLSYHQSRVNLADNILPTKSKINLPSNSPIVNGSEPSDNCNRGSHSKCTGLLRSRFGMRTVCTCSCHKNKEKK